MKSLRPETSAGMGRHRGGAPWRSRWALAAPAAVALTLVLAGPALADTYCVDINDPMVCDMDFNDDVQGALDEATGNLGADIVRIGPNPYGAGPYTYPGGGAVAMIGSGQGQTILTIDSPGTAIERVLSVSGSTGSTVSDLTIEIPDDGADTNGDRGLVLADDGVAERVSITGATVDNATGVELMGSTFRNGNVTLPITNPSNRSFLASDSAVIEDAVAQANTGVDDNSTAGTITVRRANIRATTGVSTDNGQVDIENSIIDLGSDDDSEGLEVANFNAGSATMTINADHVTILGGGTGAVGARAFADNGTETAIVNLTNSVIDNPPGTALSAETGNGRPATITTYYSNYDASTNNDGDAAGTDATITETNQTNFAPGFVNPGSADYHLAPSSALIDIGDPAAPAGGDTDIDGDPRALDGDGDGTVRRDIGADEALVVDWDGDGVANAADNCPITANAAQTNSDADANGDACDPDDDNDSVLDSSDNCPTDANASQTDSDGDGTGDACDSTPHGTDVIFELTGKKRVKAGRAVKVKATCPSEPCELTARAIFKVPNAALASAAKKKTTKIKTKKLTMSLSAGAIETLKLNLKKKQRRKLIAAAKRKSDRRKIKVIVKGTASDLGGNTEAAKLKLRLK